MWKSKAEQLRYETLAVSVRESNRINRDAFEKETQIELKLLLDSKMISQEFYDQELDFCLDRSGNRMDKVRERLSKSMAFARHSID